MELTTEQINSIKELAKKYDIDLRKGYEGYSGIENFEDSNLRPFISLSRASSYEVFYKMLVVKKNLAKLCLLIYKCIEHEAELKFSATIKGISEQVNINDFSLNDSLLYLANTLLYQELEDSYYDEPEQLFPEKNLLDLGNYPEHYSEFYELFTEDELRNIILLEDKNIEENIKSTKHIKEFWIAFLVNKYKDIGIFNSNVKLISTNDACFIYDSLVILGIESELEDKRQKKYEKVRDWLKVDQKYNLQKLSAK